MSACRVIAITGAPGAGKTEVGRALIERCPPGSALLDSDAVAGIHPFVVDDDFNRLAAANLGACIEGFLAWGARTLVLTGVLIPDGILGHMTATLADPRLSWRFYGLRASAPVLAARLAADPKPQDAAQRAQWAHLDADLDRIPGCRIVSTDRLAIDAVVDAIAELEGLGAEARA
jgi:AAA domain